MNKFVKKYGKHILFSVCNLALLVAPVLATSRASAYYWGETEIPESLKN